MEFVLHLLLSEEAELLEGPLHILENQMSQVLVFFIGSEHGLSAFLQVRWRLTSPEFRRARGFED